MKHLSPSHPARERRGGSVAKARGLARLLGLGLAAGLLAAGAVATEAPALAQTAAPQAPNTKGAVIKGRAPVSKEVLKVSFPRPQEFVLKNGLTVMIMEDHRLPTVLFQLQLPNGTLVEPLTAPGIAVATAALVREGAGGRSSADIARQLDDVGGEFFTSVSFGSNVSNIGVSGLSEHTDALLGLFLDLILRPDFPQEEVEKYRTRELAELEQQRSRPNFLAQERFMAALYPNDQMAATSMTVASLQNLSREALQEFHARYYRPRGATLAVTGDVDLKSLVKQLEQRTAGWQGEPPAAGGEKTYAPAAARQLLLVDRQDSVQTALLMGNVGLRRTDPDYVPVMVMNRIFGSDASSRLFLILREQKGYTYGAYSRFRMTEAPGPWTASAEVRTEVTEAALEAFIQELERIRTEPVTETELADARRAITARFALSLEKAQTLTELAQELRRFGLPADYWDRYPAMVEAVTQEEILRVARKYLNPSLMQIVVVGDGARIREGLQRFGTILEFDTAGNRVSP